jgi:hypothetical protein
MKQKNLFDAIKTFINNESVGTIFTTKQLIAAVGENEESTRWKRWNNNPFYRTYTYKAYLKRTGFVSFLRKGVWKIEKHLPESYNLGTIEFLLGYKGKTYNGKTREEILNPKPTSLNLGPLKVGDIIKLENNDMMRAKKDAIAEVKFIDNVDNDTWVTVEWLDDLAFGQKDGKYDVTRFTKIKEEASQKEDRIFEENKKEKVMKDLKFNFEEGKQRVTNMLEEHIADFTNDMFQDIKIIVAEDGSDALDQIDDIIETIHMNTNYCEKAIGRVKIAKSIAEVLGAMENTCYEEMEETILNELFGLESITIE